MRLLHAIRLKGPWNYLWLSPPYPELSQPPFAEAGTVKLPAEWPDSFGEQCGEVCWSRRFQRPTNLSPQERVLIRGAGISGIRDLNLGTTPLRSILPAGETGFLVDVTELLEPTNLFSCIQQTQPGEAISGMHTAITIEIWSVESDSAANDESGGFAAKV